jgi:3-hydroxyisobutyrate dehydrogenase-like beta-hydroxyacid dehydrogenase
MSETIGFIGLGLLGFPMAKNLLDSGYSLRVYNRTASKADPLVALGAKLAEKPEDAVVSGEVVVSVVWDDAALESIVTSEGFLEKLGKGGVHISMSTVSPECAKRVAKLHDARGCHYLEAPVFGVPAAATARQLTIPMSGEKAVKNRVKPILEALGGKNIFDFGDAPGAAVAVKIAGNFLIISAARSMNEAFSMAEKNGVDLKALVHMITTTLFSAPIYQSYGARLANKEPMLQSQIPLKDMGLFKQTAEAVGTPSAIVDRLLELLKS